MNETIAIHAPDLKRVETEEEIAKTAGFALQAPIYALGTPVNEVGADNFAASRASFEKLPRFRDVMTKAVQQIESEQRKDTLANLVDLEMGDDGRVQIPGERSPLAMSKRAFEQMMYRADMPRGSASYLENCPTPLRSLNVNEWLRVAPAAVVLRTRKSQKGREVFATLSDHRYHIYDAEQVMHALAENLPTGARGELLYDGSRLKLTAHYHSDIKPASAVAGEIFRAAITVDTADDGSRAIRVQAAVTRNLCRNLIILHVAKKEEIATHLDVDIEEKVPALIKAACERVRGFAERWTEASKERIAEKAGDSYDVTPVFTELVEEGLVSITNVKDDEMIGRLLRAWHKEPGNTRAHVLNAITRAAHEETWGNPWVTSELEEQAGQLLYNFQTWGAAA